jgi:tetratricopeptide (TPR) repeat protein
MMRKTGANWLSLVRPGRLEMKLSPTFRLPRSIVACLMVSFAALPRPLRADKETERLIEGGHWKRARALVENRLKAHPDDASANYDLLRVDLAFGDLEQAARAGEKAIQLNRANADYHAQLATVYANAAERATVLKQVVLVHKMHHEIEAALTIDPNNVNALLVEAVFDWQAPTIVGGGRQKSLAVIDRLKSVSPLWGNLVEARLFQNEDRHRTEQALLVAANLTPPFYRARVFLADFYASGKDASKWPEAERIAKECVQQYPDRVAAYSTLAKLYAEEGRTSDLDALLSEAEKNVPDDLSPCYFAAKILLDRNRDPEHALSYLRKYLSQEPEASEPEPATARTLLAAAAERISASNSAGQTVSLHGANAGAGVSQ